MITAIYAGKGTSLDDVAADAKSVTRQAEGARAFIAAKGWACECDHGVKQEADDASHDALHIEDMSRYAA